MPPGGMADGAPVAPAANAPVTPPQVPSPFASPLGVGPVDPNQATTKPRQMPGDSGNDNGGPPGVEDDKTMDPVMNGSEGGPGSPAGQPPQSPPPSPVQAKRQHAATVLAMMKVARRENPDLSQRQAYELAKEALVVYPIAKQAEGETGGLDGIRFGDRGDVPDGEWTRKLKNWVPGGGKGKGSTPEPEPEPEKKVYDLSTPSPRLFPTDGFPPPPPDTTTLTRSPWDNPPPPQSQRLGRRTRQA